MSPTVPFVLSSANPGKGLSQTERNARLKGTTLFVIPSEDTGSFLVSSKGGIQLNLCAGYFGRHALTAQSIDLGTTPGRAKFVSALAAYLGRDHAGAGEVLQDLVTTVRHLGACKFSGHLADALFTATFEPPIAWIEPLPNDVATEVLAWPTDCVMTRQLTRQELLDRNAGKTLHFMLLRSITPTDLEVVMDHGEPCLNFAIGDAEQGGWLMSIDFPLWNDPYVTTAKDHDISWIQVGNVETARENFALPVARHVGDHHDEYGIMTFLKHEVAPRIMELGELGCLDVNAQLLTESALGVASHDVDDICRFELAVSLS
jgi:hypothetical protein